MSQLSLVLHEPRERPSDELARSLRLWLRLRVMFNSRRLDQELAENLPATGSEERLLRAGQLTDPGHCGALASAVREVVRDAEHPGSDTVSFAVPIRRAAVNACRESLFGIAESLDHASRSDVSGVARARALLCDGTGPLFNKGSGRSLAQAIAWIEEGFASPASGAR